MKKTKLITVFLIGLILGTTISVTAALVTSANNITFSSDKTDKTNVKEAIDELYFLNDNNTQCPSGYECTKIDPLSIVEIGDYVKMTPTITSYTIPTSLTGYTTNQVINPSELNLWRVIRKNDDGTVEVVSEYVSNTKVYFSGKEGYINLVSGLNTIAAQYTNEKYVQRTRHMGYSNQTGKLTNVTSLTKTTPPWMKSTSIYNQWTGCNTSSFLCGSEETNGAGDIGYETDYNSVNNALKTMVGKTPGGTVTEYWQASRLYLYDSNTVWGFACRYVITNGRLNAQSLYDYHSPSGFGKNSVQASIRPILTLKADAAIINGDGKSADTAYVFK